MQVPPITDPCWSRLAKSESMLLMTRHIPTQMLLDRVHASNDDPAIKVAFLFAYFARWSDTLAPELAQIRQL